MMNAIIQKKSKVSLTMKLSIVILAAGQGKRMHSVTPKVLHRLAGRALLEHVVHTTHLVQKDVVPFVVYGHQGEQIRHRLADLNVHWVEQKEQLGTAHALLQALPHIPTDHRVLVLYGDVPLISPETLKQFLTIPDHSLGIMTAFLSNPFGLGRIIRDQNKNITAIIEERDLPKHYQAIQEINTGIYLFPSQFLHRTLHQIKNNNNQQEYYLPDVIEFAIKEDIPLQSMQPLMPEEILGVNDRVQLAQLERFHQKQLATQLMRQGVTLLDPERIDIRGDVTIGSDVTLDINVVLEGRVVIGNHCFIGPHTLIRNTVISDHVEIKSHCHLDGAEIGAGCMVGPFARLRPGTVLAAEVHIGNFVEIKNSEIDNKSKINHLSYIGDSAVGQKVNIGAGTITCNYDGINKHRTIIEDHVFIGSNTELVAPVIIGKGATIGAGSTITKNAPPHQLTLARARQKTIENWQGPKKKES